MQTRRILVVDDEPNVALVLANSLKKLSETYDVQTANSGEEALRRLEREPYALVLTDYRMPGMSGIDLAMAVRRIAPQTQVVLMTAYGTNGLRDTVGDLKLDGYIDKPFTMAQVREIVEQAVGRTEEEDAFRRGERKLAGTVYEPLQALQHDTGARCVMLISSSGYPIESVGATTDLDLGSIGALVAANFMAAVELSRLLGNISIFKSSYHEGPDYNIYAYDVNGELLLTVIFGSESRPGTVWFYTKQTVVTLNEMDLEEATMIDFDEELGEDFGEEIDRGLDDLFSFEDDSGPSLFESWGAEVEAQDEVRESAPQHDAASDIHGLMNLDEAIAAGILPGNILSKKDQG